MSSQLEVRVRDLETRRLVTLRAEPNEKIHVPHAAIIKGALVRVYPAADTTDTELEGLRNTLAERGAQSVRVMPKPSAHQVVKAPSASKTEHMSARKYVLRMVEESNSNNREALSRVCSETMDRNGL